MNHLAAPHIPDEPTLLIIPFEDLSEHQDHDYLARGMAEEIAVQLSVAHELRLLSNRAFSPFLAHASDPAALAEEFGADLILTGSMQPQDNRFKMFVELVDARSAEQLWVSSYNRPREDIYLIQSEVAQQIANLLLQRAIPPRSSSPVTGLRAYDYYLQGRQFLAEVNPDSTAQAIELFRQTLELDANYAPAVASLATALAMQGFLYRQDEDILEEALECAGRAIALDSELADGHYARALALMGLARFADSRLAIDRAAELSPSHVDAIFLAGALADIRGDRFASVNYYRRALELNPRLPRTVALAKILYLLGDEETALSVGRRGVDLQPGAPTLYYAHLMTLMEHHEEALEHCRDAIRLNVPRAKNLCGFSAYVAGETELARQWFEQDWTQAPTAQWGPFTFAASATHLAALNLDRGDRVMAIKLLEQSESVTRHTIDAGNDHWALRYNLALVAALRGDQESSLEWLRAAYSSGLRNHRLLALDPALSSIRDNVEFKQLQREVGFYVLDVAERLGIPGPE